MSKVNKTVSILRQNAIESISELFEVNQKITSCIVGGNAPDATLVNELLNASAKMTVYKEVTSILDGLEGDNVSDPLVEVAYDANQAIFTLSINPDTTEIPYQKALRAVWSDVESIAFKGLKKSKK